MERCASTRRALPPPRLTIRTSRFGYSSSSTIRCGRSLYRPSCSEGANACSESSSSRLFRVPSASSHDRKILTCLLNFMAVRAHRAMKRARASRAGANREPERSACMVVERALKMASCSGHCCDSLFVLAHRHPRSRPQRLQRSYDCVSDSAHLKSSKAREWHTCGRQATQPRGERRHERTVSER